MKDEQTPVKLKGLFPPVANWREWWGCKLAGVVGLQTGGSG